MQTLPIGRYRFFQRLQPISVLNQIISKKTSGCLQVFSASGTWLIYLEEGKVIYACYGDNMLDTLLSKLQILRKKIPTLNAEVYQRIKTIFDTSIDNKAIPYLDYLAICWLVNRKHLTCQQAKLLIEELALDVLTSILKIQEGSYEITANSALENIPQFCQLDLSALIANSRSRVEHSKKSTDVSARKTPQQDLHTATESSHQHHSKIGNQGTEYHPENQKQVYTILCIDDSLTVLAAIQRFLDEQIFRVVTISEPVKALIQIIRLKPDLILLDVGMPNLDGYELCGLVRKHAHFKHTPIIMVTARTGLIDRARAKMLGASGYLTKPFTQADLLKVIFHHLS